MLVAQKEIIVNHSDKLTGVALCNKELGNQKEYNTYSAVGFLANVLSPEVIQGASAVTGALATHVAKESQNEKIAGYEEGIGYVSSEVTKIGLSSIKQLAAKADKFVALEGIVKLMRYCTEEQTGSFIQDTTVAEIIAGLPIKNETGYKIYTGKPIVSPEEVIGVVNYSARELENIGYLLYFMTRAKCSQEEMRLKSHLWQTLSVMNTANRKEDYEIQYRKNAYDKADQVREACYEFQNLKSDKLQLNPKYISRVVRNMSYYMPADCKLDKEVLVVTANGMDALIDRDVNKGINVAGEGIALILDACLKKKDMVKEEVHRKLVEQGVAGNLVSGQIMKTADEIHTYYDDVKE